jgi:dolichyl-phosphate-mannose-protein mannosyltransferase
MTVPEDVRERASAARSDSSRGGGWAAGAPFGPLADRVMRVPWLWPALLTAILGCYQLGRPELWRDELASWSFAIRPVPDLITTARHVDVNHLAYYLLLHYWIAAFGDSVDAMRALSVLAMAGAAACVTLAGRRLAGARAGLLAGLVFALVPSVSRFAQEIRSYALDMLVATLATLLLLRALDQPAVRRWTVYGACLAVLGYLNPVALAVVTGHAAVVAMRWQRDRDNRLFFVRNLFYSTSVAAAFILLAILAWAGHDPRVWVVVSGDTRTPCADVTSGQAAALRSNYRVSYRKYVPSLTVFLLTRT